MAICNDGESATVSPNVIIKLSTAYWGSQALLTANRIGLFDALAEGSMTGAAVAAKLTLDPRATELLLNACVALGLCEKHSEQYSNSDSSARFLVATSPHSMANAIHYSDHLYATWGQLEAAVKSGIPPKTAATYLGEDEEQTRHFVYGMHDRAMAIGQALPELLDLSGRKRMLDVGGGPGTYSALLTRRFPGLRSDVLELPGVAKIAREILGDMGATEQVTMLNGDYHSSDFGHGYDTVLMSGMFHRESKTNCCRLIDKAKACMEPGGILIISDIFVDEGGLAPEFATLFGLNMMLTAPDGGVHSDADIARWMRDAGFEKLALQPFPAPMPHRIVSGIKT